VAPCRSCVSRRFGGTYAICSHLLMLVPRSRIFSNLKMEATRSSETSVHTRSTRRHIPENGILQSHRCENIKSYINTVCSQNHMKQIYCEKNAKYFYLILEHLVLTTVILKNWPASHFVASPEYQAIRSEIYEHFARWGQQREQTKYSTPWEHVTTTPSIKFLDYLTMLSEPQSSVD
jgi:hypothetical protein